MHNIMKNLNEYLDNYIKHNFMEEFSAPTGYVKVRLFLFSGMDEFDIEDSAEAEGCLNDNIYYDDLFEKDFYLAEDVPFNDEDDFDILGYTNYDDNTDTSTLKAGTRLHYADSDPGHLEIYATDDGRQIQFTRSPYIYAKPTVKDWAKDIHYYNGSNDDTDDYDSDMNESWKDDVDLTTQCRARLGRHPDHGGRGPVCSFERDVERNTYHVNKDEELRILYNNKDAYEDAMNKYNEKFIPDEMLYEYRTILKRIQKLENS